MSDRDSPLNAVSDRAYCGEREGGFSLLELLVVMAVIGALAAAGLSAFSSYRKQTAKAEAEAAWQELSMAVNLFRIDKGYWPDPYTHAQHVGFIALPMGALTINLAPKDYVDPDRRVEEDMVGDVGTGGPILEQGTGHLVLAVGQVCAWVDGFAAGSNDEDCPED